MQNRQLNSGFSCLLAASRAPWALGKQLVLWYRTSNRRPWLVHGIGGSSRAQLYDSHHSPQPEPTYSWLAWAGPPSITVAAAALLVTDRCRHVPPRTPAPPRKQLSRILSALARVSYWKHVGPLLQRAEMTSVSHHLRKPSDAQCWAGY